MSAYFPLNSHSSTNLANTSPPYLLLSLKSQSGEPVQVTQLDALQTFMQFGIISSLETVNKSILILFKESSAADITQKLLHGRILVDSSISISLTWYYSFDLTTSPYIKYNCKIGIPINNEEFPVSRMIIGPCGSNMKRIMAKATENSPGKQHEILKIRLRGKGSGYFEGSKEANESLHLCISSRKYSVYKTVLQLLENLLTGIYAKYSSVHKETPQVVKQESVSMSKQFHCELVRKIHASPYLIERQIEELVVIRNEARKQAQFTQADNIRDLLRAKGIILIDSKGVKGQAPEVTSWKTSNNS